MSCANLPWKIRLACQFNVVDLALIPRHPAPDPDTRIPKTVEQLMLALTSRVRKRVLLIVPTSPHGRHPRRRLRAARRLRFLLPAGPSQSKSARPLWRTASVAERGAAEPPLAAISDVNPSPRHIPGEHFPCCVLKLPDTNRTFGSHRFLPRACIFRCIMQRAGASVNPLAWRGTPTKGKRLTLPISRPVSTILQIDDTMLASSLNVSRKSPRRKKTLVSWNCFLIRRYSLWRGGSPHSNIEAHLAVKSDSHLHDLIEHSAVVP